MSYRNYFDEVYFTEYAQYPNGPYGNPARSYMSLSRSTTPGNYFGPSGSQQAQGSANTTGGRGTNMNQTLIQPNHGNASGNTNASRSNASGAASYAAMAGGVSIRSTTQAQANSTSRSSKPAEKGESKSK